MSVLAQAACLLVLAGVVGCDSREDPQRLWTMLAEGQGGVLHLPLEMGAPGQGAPRGSNAAWSQAAERHGRPVVAGSEVFEAHAAFADPLLLLSLSAYEGQPRFALPPGRPGQVLVELGTTNIVVDRDRMGQAGMAFLDPILRRALQAPQRDLVSAHDIYSLKPRTGPLGAGQAPAVPLRPAAGDLPAGWLPLEDYLVAWR